MASLIGKEIGKYRITERIGRGGMADVYLGIHTHLDRKVAVKVLHSHLLEGGDFVARFKREAKAVANLRHPNIVQVYDFDVQDDMIFMVMEYIDGASLHSRLVEVGNRGERMPIKLIGSIINDIASALDYAHSKNMLHRDIKPSNILLDKNDKAYLTDFGIAKLLDDQKFTATGQLVGTPAYMSPEQGMGEDLTEESDIYSLGIVAFEMLTGQVPYDAKTPIGIVHKQINDPVPDLSQLVDGVPGTAQDVLNRALAKSPEGRFNRAEDLVKALRVALQALDSTEPIVKQAAAQVEEILDAPTVTMDVEELDQPTVVMEEQKPEVEAKPEKAPAPKPPAGEKKKIPLWAYIAGGVALLAVLGVILTQVLDFGSGGDGDDLPEGAITASVHAAEGSEGISIITPDDGNFEYVVAGRSAGWRTGNGANLDADNQNTEPDSFIYFQIDDDILYQLPEGSSAYIDIEIWNSGEDTLLIEYDGHAAGGFTSTKAIQKTDSGEFTTVRFLLSNPFFGNRTNGGDFRIADNNDGEEVIRSTKVVYLPDGDASAAEGDGEGFYDQGLAFFESGDAHAAVEYFERALDAGFETYDLYFYLGNAKRDTGDYNGAIENLRVATELDPDNFGAWYSLAEAYLNTGEEIHAGDAHQAMDHALALDPDNPNAHWLIGMIRYEMFDNPDDAILDLSRAIELDPNSSFYYHMRAYIYQGKEQWDLCVADENEAISLGTDDPHVYYRRGECYSALGDFDLARADFEEFLGLTEGNTDLADARQEAQNWLAEH